MKTFGNILKELRTQNHYTQKTLADALCISKSAISMYERGEREPDMKTLCKIADFYQVDINYFFDKSEAPIKRTPSFLELKEMIKNCSVELSTEQKLELIQILSEKDNE